MTIGTNDSSPPAGLAPGLALSPAPAFDVGLVPGTITAPAPGVIASRVAPMVINPHTTFYYGKAVTI